MHRIVLYLAVALCLVSLPALADHPQKPNRLEQTLSMEMSEEMLQGTKSGIVTDFFVGFEPEEGFVPGFIQDQVGWVTYSDQSMIEPHISTDAPATGTQHIRFGFDPLIPPTFEALVAVGPDIGPQSNIGRRSSLIVDVKIDGLGGADYEVVPSTPSQGLLVGRVDFNYLGTILIADFIDGGFQFVDTGVPWLLDEYGELRIDVDPVADSIEYYYEGQLIYTSVAGILGGSFIERVNLFSDNFNLNDVGDFDNIRILVEGTPVVVPTLGQVGFAALVLSLLVAAVIRLRQR